MQDCIFCKIVQKEIPSKIAGESGHAFAFHDIHPQAPVHILVIPKEHIHSILEVEKSQAETLTEMVALAKECAANNGVKESGFRLVFNCGPNAGQAVDHLHMHLLGKRKLAWPPG